MSISFVISEVKAICARQGGLSVRVVNFANTANIFLCIQQNNRNMANILFL